MKRVLALMLMLMLACSAFAETLPLLDPALFADRFMTNPRAINDIGDPFILPADGRYYLFATGGPNSSDDVNVWISDDLVSFTTQKALEGVSWAAYDYWAPEVHRWKDQYVMLYSARRASDMSLRVGIAFSDTPEGPYTDPLGAPLFDFGYAAIDASLFVDDDGTPYLLYSMDCSENYVNGCWESHSYGVQLSDDLLSTVGEPVLLTTPDKAWEKISGEYRWNEGPFIVKNDGRYYLYYSANYYASIEYAVGVAVADHPLGPYHKSTDNPIMQYKSKNGQLLASGTGHNSFFTVGDELFTAYHSHTVPDAPSDFRQVCVDRAGFHSNGSAYINGPTLAPQLKPLADLGLVNHVLSARCDADPRSLLSDGDICLNSYSYPYTWSGDSLELVWDEPVTTGMLLIYPAQGASISGTVTLNNTLVADFSSNPSATLGEPVALFFDPIPVSSLTLTLSAPARLGELLAG